MKTDQKIIFTFNQFFASLIKDLKKADDDLKQSLKKSYKVLDKLSTDHYELFWNSMKSSVSQLVGDESGVNTDAVVLKNLTVGDIVGKLKANDKQVFWNYVYILTVFGIVYNTYDVSGELTEEDEKQWLQLYEKVLVVLRLLQNSEKYENELEDILDDDIKSLLDKVVITKESSADASTPPFPNMPGDSKIMNLAKEISENIDVSGLKLDTPEDVMKMMDFSGSNNVLGDIIGKVTTTIQDKIGSGEIKQDELFNEAMSMMGGMGGAGGMGGMGAMFNNPMFSQMMKNMKKGKTTTRNTGGASSDTKDRLRRKLDQKKIVKR